jgi:hypothetical protein
LVRVHYKQKAERHIFFFLNSHSATNNHDPWNGLATLMTLLEMAVDINKDYLALKREKGKFILALLTTQHFVGTALTHKSFFK